MYIQKTNASSTKAEILAEIVEVITLINKPSGTEELETKYNELLAKKAELENSYNAVLDEIKPDFISVVIPFNAGDSETELLYLVRSIEKNFGNNFKIAIVGAAPVAKLDVILIEHEAKSSNRQVNLVHAIQAACLSDQITERFVVAPLDTYFISPVTLADIETFKHTTRKMVGLDEEQSLSNTYRLLNEKLGVSKTELNFATGLPFVIEKQKFAELFVDFQEIDAIPVFVETIYKENFYPLHSSLELNFKRDNIQLLAISKDPSPELFNSAITGKKFITICDSAKGSFIENFLNVKFENQCSIELE